MRAPEPPPLEPELEALLRRLRLPHIRRTAPEVLATARAQRWEPAEVLRALLVEEVAGRDRSSAATRRAAAGFPAGKTFDAWEPSLTSIPAPTQSALRTLEWVHRRENLVVCGPSGTGKTFFLEALGQPPSRPGGRWRGSPWRPSGCWSAATAPTTPSPGPSPASCAPISIVVDDIGLLPVAHDAAEGLYRLVDAAYEKRTVAVSSNLHPSGFDELMPKTLATATVDRLLHHAHVCATQGDSVRLTQALAGKGVRPWPDDPVQIWWPWPRRTHGHHRAVLMAATVQVLLARDRSESASPPPGRHRTDARRVENGGSAPSPG